MTSLTTPATQSPADPAAHRAAHIVEVLIAEFGELMALDPAAFRRKFRKMAASPFAFYRGSACLFYADVAGQDDPFLNDRTRRVWIHGDLHAENFGTYMNSEGILVFNVNDFDEAYVGPFTWDLRRFAASVALIAYAKALSDDVITDLVTRYARAYLAELRAIAAGGEEAIGSLTLDTTQGILRDVLSKARLNTRVALLEEQTGDLKAARARIGDALDRDPSDWRLWFVSARIDVKAGFIGEARKSLARARALNPRSPLFATNKD